jgi:hypothetical protein
MKKDRFLPALGYLLISAFLAILGCTTSNLKLPESLPPIIKEYKNVPILGSQAGMKNTGIYIESGDLYSVLATGSMDFGVWTAYRNVTPEMGWPFMIRIGESYAFHPLRGNNSVTSTSYQSGYLHVGYQRGPVSSLGEPTNPQWYGYTKGYFGVDIIVWQKQDWVQIADFFAEMKEKRPSNKAVQDAVADAERYKSIYLSELKKRSPKRKSRSAN